MPAAACAAPGCGKHADSSAAWLAAPCRAVGTTDAARSATPATDPATAGAAMSGKVAALTGASRSALFNTCMCTASGDNGSSGAPSSQPTSEGLAAASDMCSTTCACWAAATARRTPSASMGQSVWRSPALSVRMTCRSRQVPAGTQKRKYRPQTLFDMPIPSAVLEIKSDLPGNLERKADSLVSPACLTCYQALSPSAPHLDPAKLKLYRHGVPGCPSKRRHNSSFVPRQQVE